MGIESWINVSILAVRIPPLHGEVVVTLHMGRDVAVAHPLEPGVKMIASPGLAEVSQLEVSARRWAPSRPPSSPPSLPPPSLP